MLQGVRRLRAPGPGEAVATVLLLTRISLPLHGEQSPALTECAKALYRADYERASSLAKEYVKAHPQAAEGRILLARAEMAQGKLESAFQQLRRALRADSDHLDTLYFLGRLCVALSQIELQKLYALAPDSSRVHQLLAESYRAQEKLDKAEEEYLAALKADPRSLEVLNALGDLKRSLLQFNEAISYYLQAAGIAPRDYDSAYGLGASYLYEGATRSFSCSASGHLAVESFLAALLSNRRKVPFPTSGCRVTAFQRSRNRRGKRVFFPRGSARLSQCEPSEKHMVLGHLILQISDV